MNEDFQHRLVKARSGHGWSQAELAEVSGIAPAQISRYEQGRSRPRTEVIAKLAKALAVSFEWLAEGRGDIDDGSTIPRYPNSHFPNPPLQLESDFQQALKRFAQAEGVTLEMAMRAVFLQAVESLDEHPERLQAIMEQIKRSKP